MGDLPLIVTQNFTNSNHYMNVDARMRYIWYVVIC